MRFRLELPDTGSAEGRQRRVYDDPMKVRAYILVRHHSGYIPCTIQGWEDWASNAEPLREGFNYYPVQSEPVHIDELSFVGPTVFGTTMSSGVDFHWCIRSLMLGATRGIRFIRYDGCRELRFTYSSANEWLPVPPEVGVWFLHRVSCFSGDANSHYLVRE